MIRSLYSGVSGMKNHQIRMDVIGNNISNVNTTGYKAARTNFQDTLYQTIRSGGKSTNPAQTGLGINVAAISSFMESGGLQGTGRTLDLAINGTGFFRVTDGVKDYYSRDGILYFDQDGYLVNSNGHRVYGEVTNTATAEGQEEFAMIDSTDSPNSEEILTLRGTLLDGTAGSNHDFTIETAGSAVMNASFDSDSDGTNNDIGAATTLNSLGFSNGDKIRFSYVNQYTNENVSFDININNGLSIDENSTLGNLKDEISTSGVGVVMDISETDDNITFTTSGFGPGVSLTVTTLDSNNEPVQRFNGTDSDFNSGIANKTGTGDDIDSIINKINEQSEITGVVASKGKNNNLVLTTLDQTEKATMSISGDAAGYLGLPTTGAFESERPVTPREMKITSDSLPVDSLTILPDGTILGTDNEGFPLQWEDGPTTAGNADIAKILLFGFSNQDGLKRVSSNLFETSASSGDAIAGAPGSPGYGTVESGYIELSNVDLTDQFTDMITTQRGYQAGARIITVSDTMLEELINLKR